MNRFADALAASLAQALARATSARVDATHHAMRPKAAVAMLDRDR